MNIAITFFLSPKALQLHYKYHGYNPFPILFKAIFNIEYISVKFDKIRV